MWDFLRDCHNTLRGVSRYQRRGHDDDMEKSDVLLKRREKATGLKERGINLYPNDFRVSHGISDIQRALEAAPEGGPGEGASFSTAGRIMAVNRFGKSAFIRFKDQDGQMQAYIRQDKVGASA